MSNKCELTGKRPLKGHNVSHANNKTKRKFNPSIKKIKFKSDILKKNIKLHCGENENSVADLTGVAVQDIQIAKAVFKQCEE